MERGEASQIPTVRNRVCSCTNNSKVTPWTLPHDECGFSFVDHHACFLGSSPLFNVLIESQRKQRLSSP
jgi:hypothetical protein